ncbi:SAM-dependent methyltransferase [Conyzicola lurida]|uniref:SAM-dependent methyltransferase n=1 Tax=Conyzicola lurida TaxID=1172621 RepID=A0A841ALL6_9MICO|nr:class I SAM-dependent methyltransferase [Conyzicola lurida]MBB5844880.1 SAM-dependent methyltransferase [Conyzicola lurida]
MTRDAEHALSFGNAVGDYEKGRPSYPREAVDWIVAQTDEPHDAVDVGAGTGKFTASLVARGLAVSAVEPDPAMLARLASNHPSVVSLAGSAEQLPLDDTSADLVTFAQSWHWVDVPAASAEVARVLRPGGALALVWNIRDPEVDWVRQLGEVMGESKAEQYNSHEPSVAEPLALAEFAEFRWENPLSREELFAMVASRSYVITMEVADREALLARLGELLDTHPETAGLTEYRMPYLTRVTIARAARAD